MQDTSYCRYNPIRTEQLGISITFCHQYIDELQTVQNGLGFWPSLAHPVCTDRGK